MIAIRPSDVSSPSGSSVATAITEQIAAVAMFESHSTRRRSNRSMNTPMNGLMNVYGM